MIHKVATVTVRKADGQDEITVNSGQPDRGGDRVFPDGDLTDYARNPVVMWAHDYHNIPLGTCSYIKASSDAGLVAGPIKWLAGDAFAERVKNAWDQKVLRAVSIGFAPSPNPEDSQRNEFGGTDYHNWKMLEFSIVPIPADPQALRRAKGFEDLMDTHDVGETLGVIRKLLEQIERAEWDTAYVNDLPDSSFAAIMPGGEKDSEGKTTPRSLRKLPHHKAGGAVDLPHLRNALARVSQADLGGQKAKAEAHLEAHAKAENIGERSVPVAITKEMLKRHKEIIKDAMENVKDAMDMMAAHHKAHNAVHKAHKDAMEAAHKALNDLVKEGEGEGHPEPDEDDKPGYTGPGDDDADNKAVKCACDGCKVMDCACVGETCKDEACKCACHGIKGLLSRMIKR